MGNFAKLKWKTNKNHIIDKHSRIKENCRIDKYKANKMQNYKNVECTKCKIDKVPNR